VRLVVGLAKILPDGSFGRIRLHFVIPKRSVTVHGGAGGARRTTERQGAWDAGRGRTATATRDRLEQIVRQSFWRSSAAGALVIGRRWIVWSGLSSSVATRCARCAQFRQGIASRTFLGREDTHSHFSGGARRHRGLLPAAS